MRTTIFAYTGTGNSLWAARTLAASLGEAQVSSLVQAAHAAPPRCDSEAVGFAFPVHMWGLPPPIVDFARRLEVREGAYLFAVAVHAGQVSRTLIQLDELLASRKLGLAAGWSLEMPSNYAPWGGPGPLRKQQARFDASRLKLAEISAAVGRRERRAVEAGPLWQRVLLTQAYKMATPHLGKMDKSFWVDERCNGCGICARVCPAKNIEIAAGKPRWLHRCEQCFACLQWCPQLALQSGKRTARYPRYHHPEVKLAEVIELVAPARSEDGAGTS